MRFKRGVVEVQFNWVFVLIIGAVILILFTAVILKQKDVSETSQSALVLKNLETILSGSETSKGTSNLIDIPEKRIEFSCNRYSVGGLSNRLDVMNVFAPQILEGEQLLSLTLDFSVPYRATNLIYLTNPNYKYIIIGTSEEARDVADMMPNQSFSQRYDNLDEVEYKGESKARFVIFDSDPPDSLSDTRNLEPYASLADEDVTAVSVKSNIKFFEKKDDEFEESGESNYIGLKSLLGAVFADNAEIYDCAMESVFEKLNVVTQVYRNRTNGIVDRYESENDRCKDAVDYDTAKLSLSRIISFSSSFNAKSIDDILRESRELEGLNEDAQFQSCATIY